MRNELTIAVAALTLAACGADTYQGTRQEQCMVALMDTEKEFLKADKWGEPPEAVRLSAYGAHRCIRLRSILRASENGTDEEVAVRAVTDCAPIIARANAEQERWEHKPVSQDPAIESEYRRITAPMQRSGQEIASEDASLRRVSAALTVRLARPGKCWELLKASDKEVPR